MKQKPRYKINGAYPWKNHYLLIRNQGAKALNNLLLLAESIRTNSKTIAEVLSTRGNVPAVLRERFLEVLLILLFSKSLFKVFDSTILVT